MQTDPIPVSITDSILDATAPDQEALGAPGFADLRRCAHVAIVRADYDATLTRLRDAGVEISERKAYWGSPRAFVRSPAGHRVEVMRSPPAGPDLG